MFETIPLFPTAIYRALHPAAAQINPALRERILQRRAQTATQNKSMRGGWQSRRDFLRAGDPASEALLKLLDAGITLASARLAGVAPANVSVAYDLSTWANCSEAGDYNLVHDHPLASWSAVYYVSCPPPAGEAPDEGNLSFVDPRNNAQVAGIGTPRGIRFDIAPKEGLMVLFPSWLRHAVIPHRSAQPRMSIACNALVTSFAVREADGPRPG